MALSTTPSINARTVRVAAVQARAQELANDGDFEQRIDFLISQAKQKKADIVVLPEDIGLWLELAHGSPRVLTFHLAAGMFPVAPSPGAAAPAPTATPKPIRPLASSTTKVNPVGGLIDILAGHLIIPALGNWLAAKNIVSTYKRALKKAAKKYGVVIVGGSIYEKRKDGLFVTCYVFDRDGKVAGKYDKHHLVPLEKCFGAIESTAPIEPIRTKDFIIGACICYDLNFGPGDAVPVVKALKDKGAQIICAGSAGLRSGPGQPYTAADTPQIQRAQESGLSIARAYQSGWLLPGIIYMDGLTDIVLPDGKVIVKSYPRDRKKEKVFCAEVPLG